MKIWLINPYGPIPSEAWRTYCFPLIAEVLTNEGHEVIWWTSNFAHHFKKFRSDGWADIVVSTGFRIRLVPTTGYNRNIGFGRVFRDALSHCGLTSGGDLSQAQISLFIPSLR